MKGSGGESRLSWTTGEKGCLVHTMAGYQLLLLKQELPHQPEGALAVWRCRAQDQNAGW